MDDVLKSTFATLIGDVVASRREESQEEMLRSLDAAQVWVNERVEAAQPLRPTLGDEFQGIYENVALALKAALLMRLRLKGVLDLRFGIGWGEVLTTAPDQAPLGQSGAGWWAAREAVEEAATLAKKSGWPRSVRVRVRGLETSEAAAINALAICQDQVLSKMDRKDCQIAIGLFEGSRQDELAEGLGVSQSEVSRRQLENGPASLFRAYQSLRGLAP